jgi:GNAT superfamily N-acetyltransferase
VEDHLVLDLPASRSVPTPAGYRLRQWVGPCPDEHVASYAALQSAMNADVPTGGMTRTAVTVSPERVRTSEQRLAQSYLTIVTSAVTDDDEPAGYSLVMVPLEDPADVVQDDTLVLRAHRGHGLGAVMKAANLRLLADHARDAARLHTWTAQENGPMQAINAGFGFRAVETMHEMERRA